MSLGLTEWALIAEIIGGIAVVGSLLFVGVEVRKNSAASRANAFQALSESVTQVTETVAISEQLTRLVRLGHADPRALREDERIRFLSILMVYWRRFEAAFIQHQLGIISSAEWKGFSAALDFQLSTEGGRAWWSEFESWFSPQFRSYVTNRISRTATL